MTNEMRHGMRCFCCHGERHVTLMTDGATSHTVCDECRPLVTTLFYVYGNMSRAVLETAQAKRGTRESDDAT